MKATYIGKYHNVPATATVTSYGVCGIAVNIVNAKDPYDTLEDLVFHTFRETESYLRTLGFVVK